MRKKRALTLLEIMIVIFLITLITGTIGYSLKGTMDKGRAFRTMQAREQLHDLLLIALAEEKGTAAQIAAQPLNYIKALGMAKDPDKLILDGWNERFIIQPSGETDFNIRSTAWDNYRNRERRRINPSVNSSELVAGNAEDEQN